MSQVHHIDDETLDLYALGKLADDEVERVEEHTLICEACLDRLEQHDQFIAALKASPQIRRIEEPFRSAELPWFRRLPELIRAMRWQSAAVVLAAAVATFAIVPPLLRQDAPYQDVDLRAMRGASDAGKPPTSNHRFRLHLDVTGVETAQTYRVSLVSSSGKLLWEGRARPDAGPSVVVSLPRPLDAGQYWVRLYNSAPDSPPLREFDLKVHR